MQVYFKLGGVFDFSDSKIYDKVVQMSDETLLKEVYTENNPKATLNKFTAIDELTPVQATVLEAVYILEKSGVSAKGYTKKQIVNATVAYERVLRTQQLSLLDRIEKEVVGEDDTSLYQIRDANKLRAEQRKAIDNIRKELRNGKRY